MSKNDPDRIVDVAGSPDYQAIGKRMARKLHRWMRRTGDPRADPNDMSFDEYPYVRKAMKALVLDMDGTLVDADGKVFLWVSEKVKELYSRGIKISSSPPKAR